jgi:2'-5' RNA ligase
MAILSFALSWLPSLVTVVWIIVVMLVLAMLPLLFLGICRNTNFRVKELEGVMITIAQTLAQIVDNQKLEWEILQDLQTKADLHFPPHEPDGGTQFHRDQHPIALHEESPETDERRQLMADIRELLAPVRRLTSQHKQFVEHMVQIQQLRGTLKELARQVVDLRIHLEARTDGNEVCCSCPSKSAKTLIISSRQRIESLAGVMDSTS